MAAIQIPGEWTAHNTDIDANGHVYNAVYADVASNIMSPEEFEADVSDMRINFVSEVKNGEKIELFRSDGANSTVIIGKAGEKTCFEYEIINSQYNTLLDIQEADKYLE